MLGAGTSPAEAPLSEGRDWGWQPGAEVMGHTGDEVPSPRGVLVTLHLLPCVSPHTSISLIALGVVPSLALG